MLQSSTCRAAAAAEDPLDPFELPAAATGPEERPVVAVDELETPLPDCTVTEEPSGMVVDPDKPPGPVVTLLESPQFTSSHSLLALAPRFFPSRLARVVTAELCVPAAVEDVLPVVAHGSCGRRSVPAP
ncbi:MAG: hypothetical protein A3I66_09855 [Burkholderiales bacterium RIFCSPLOWO2_02_FULL_57_36]|nr:MAG: hypothetical protein A3I66_09855 [Burkholderiales bacterium RIFCSPLOWO2_02_FULL_57_36]